MQKLKCSICGYVHDEEKNGLFGELAENWVCPLCKAEKSAFAVIGEVSMDSGADTSILPDEMKELSILEVSAVCSNLARGCEKQYLEKEASLFQNLAGHFKAMAPKAEQTDMGLLLKLVEKDLGEILPAVESVAAEAKDRGVLRALTWSGKVTMILKSLLDRYQKVGNSMVENTGVYVCTICGFVYIGNGLPEACPICKVPNYKFEEVKDSTRVNDQFTLENQVMSNAEHKNNKSRLYAVRTIKMCTKDCLCLYVCPTGASDTENSIIDIEKCIGCGACANACPSKAISMVPRVLPPQQKHDKKVEIAMRYLFASKIAQENIAVALPNKLAMAVEKSNRIMAEDLIREAGFMLPQSANTYYFLQKLLIENKGENFPKETVECLLNILKINEKIEIVEAEKWKCSICGHIHEGSLSEGFTCPICKQLASVFVKL